MDDLQESLDSSMTLESWVVTQCDEWRHAQEANYFEKWDEYYRIWRGHWDAADVERGSERSKLISPATQQAVESSAAELEEATFGRGSFFDIKSDKGQESGPTALIKTKLAEEFSRYGIRKDASEAILNAAIFGTGLAEVVMDYKTEYSPATQEDEDGLPVVGRRNEEKVCVTLRPIKPHNFRIPDTATSIEDALGVGIEEFVAPDYVYDLQERGIYDETDFTLESNITDEDIEADPTISNIPTNRIKLLRYYGKVPTHLLEDVEGFTPTQNHSDMYYTEAMVVIANDGVLLKAIDNPYMMNDRPIVAFQWDIVPGRFWGRGVCEKGYNPQKALDAELRQRRDAMALSVAPVIGIDATRLPTLGQKLTVSPGKQILTNGNPSEVIHPFHMGDVPQSSWMETDNLQKMVQQATGAVDSAGIAGNINGEATAAGISMSLGAIIKRHKRTLINFQECFLIPFVKKAAYRYMQFAPEKFPAQDFDFIVTSSLGIMAREYEVSQMTQLLQTTSPESPFYSVILESIVDNMNLNNREEMIQALRQAKEPDQGAQQQQQMQMKMQMELHELQKKVLEAQANEMNARAEKYMVEAKMGPLDRQIEMVDAIAEVNNDAADDFEKSMRVVEQDFKEKLAVAEFALKEKTSREQIAAQTKQGAPQQENANGSQQTGVQQGLTGNQ